MSAPAQVSGVRVLVYALAPQAGPEGIEAAYHEISQRLAGTPGLLGNALMRSLTDPRGFVVMSEWVDMAAFRAWELGTGHRSATAPLRPFQDDRRGSAFGVYEVVAAY